MLFIYKPFANSVYRNILRPFSAILPSKFKIPVNGSFNIKLGQGREIKLVTNPTSFLSRLLFWDGVTGFEYECVRIFIELAKESKIFFDIGANMGYYSLVASAFNPGIKIFGFEPLPSANKYFKLNAQLNNFKNINVKELALSNQSGKATFYAIRNPKFKEIEDQLAGDGGLNAKQSGERSGYNFDVTIDTLDNFVSAILNAKEKIDLIKLDTEASEHLVLAGAKKVLSEHRPIIQCEILKGNIEKELDEIFTANNYLFFKIKKEGVTQRESLLNDEDSKTDYFMVPVEKKNKIEKFLLH